MVLLDSMTPFLCSLLTAHSFIRTKSRIAGYTSGLFLTWGQTNTTRFAILSPVVSFLVQTPHGISSLSCFLGLLMFPHSRRKVCASGMPTTKGLPSCCSSCSWPWRMRLGWHLSVVLSATMVGKAVDCSVDSLVATKFEAHTITRLSYNHLVSNSTKPPLTPISELPTSLKQIPHSIGGTSMMSLPLELTQNTLDVISMQALQNLVSSTAFLVP